MKLLTADIRKKLLRNGRMRQQCDEAGEPEPDFVPVVKLFTPDAGCTWLLTEIDPDDPDIAYRPVRPRPRLSGTRLRQPVGTGGRARQTEFAGRARPVLHGDQDAVRLRRRGAGAWRDHSLRGGGP